MVLGKGVVPPPGQVEGMGSAVSSPAGPGDVTAKQIKAGLVIPFHEFVGNNYYLNK